MRRHLQTRLQRSHWAAFSVSKGLNLDGILSKKLRATAKELSDEMVPALKVLSESLGLLRHSIVLKNWNASDWLVGLSVLAQYKTQLRANEARNEYTKMPAVMEKELLTKLLRYVRMCDAVYAPSDAAFCEEANILQSQVLRSHSGGVVSPRCVIVADHEHRELVLVVRGTASLLDFCTDLCLQNEPFLNGQGHRGMVHAATWLVRHLRDDLVKFSERYIDYKVVATGHSLGAAVAALSTMQLKDSFPKIHCFAFGTPACVTRELAASSYDVVTSVVNGYDCVPRLHQHSLMQLQEEIRQFNWRSALRDMVVEVYRKQKLAVEKHQRAKLNELQSALWNVKGPLKLKQRTNNAMAKLNEVKTLALNNIASEVDALLSDKLDAAYSIITMDRSLLKHDSYLKKLLKLKEGDSLWQQRISDSFIALERLVPVVNKPEELDNVLAEVKKVLYNTVEGTKTLLKRGDGSGMFKASLFGLSAMPESSQLQLLYSQIDAAIDKLRTSFPSRISEQVSIVSSAVTSNVQNYVQSIKEETAALNSAVHKEFDVVVESMSRKVPFIQRDSGNETKSLPGNELDKTNSHSDTYFPDQRDETSSEAKKKLKKLCDDDDVLRHDPLFPPGRIMYLNRFIAPKSPPKCDDSVNIHSLDEFHETFEFVEFKEATTDEFGQVVLANRMLLDHLCTDYEQVLQLQAKQQDSKQ
ncbi:hypothetical protein CCR75_005283 [Bremia lactucae]|uniref:Fungal lipase-type domain-containing protein n=1 Tax=Bremia lactucae TaxID=4779 RepID=A0A976IFZ2_BRELC|nr:hypothetical protein CCR75_005283 [Bremia lactucae]